MDYPRSVTDASPATDRDRFQRAVIAVAATANRFSAILMGTAMAVYVGRIGSPFHVGLVMTVFWLGLMVFSPVFGAIADVTGRRRFVLVSTSVVATLTVLPLTVAGGVWGPLALRGVYAVFVAAFLPVMLTIVSERGGREGRGRSLGFFNSARAVGFTAGQFFAGLLLGLVAPWVLYLIVAALTGVIAVAGLFVRDPTPAVDRDPTVEEVTAEVRRRLLPARTDRDHLRTNGLQWLYLAVFLRNATVLGTSSLLPIYLVAEIGVSEFVMGALLALNPAGQMVFMYLFGHVADLSGRKPLIVAGMGGGGIYALVMAGASIPGSALVGGVVAGIGLLLLAAAFSAETTGTYAFIGDIAPHERESELMGLHSTARGFGGAAGPAGIGLLATVWGYESSFVVASVLAFGATVLVARQLVESHGTQSDVAVPAPDD